MINIRQIILESLERPVITKHEHYSPESECLNAHKFIITHPSLDEPLEVEAYHDRVTNKAEVFVFGKNTGYKGWEKNANKLGPSNIRHMAKQIHSYMPEVTEFYGERITGAKKEAKDYSIKRASVKMSPAKEKALTA